MQGDALWLVTILGMGLATYLTRISGVWLMARVKPSPRVEAWLRYIPGSVLVSLVAPAALTAGPADALAAGCTALVAARTKNLLLSMAVGVVIAWVLRRVF